MQVLSNGGGNDDQFLVGGCVCVCVDQEEKGEEELLENIERVKQVNE